MDRAATYPLEVVIVIVHEMHTEDEEGFVSVALMLFRPCVLLIGITVQGLQKFYKCKTSRSVLSTEMLMEYVQRLELREDIEAPYPCGSCQGFDVLQCIVKIEELRNRNSILVLINKEKRHGPAVRMAGMVGDRRAGKCFRKFHKRSAGIQ